MDKQKFLFGDIIVVNNDQIGVVLKTYTSNRHNTYEYDIYNRMTSQIESYLEDQIDRYRVRHKYLDEEEIMYQNM